MCSDTIFSKIIRREIPASIVYENESVLAFNDIQPQAPTHVLIVPKEPLADVASALPHQEAVLGKLLLAAGEIARAKGLTDYRLVINNGERAGQSVFHLHIHLLGGREFRWPPG